MSDIDYLKETAVALGIFDDPSDDEHILIASFVDEIKRLRGIIEELDENLESADDELKFRQERIEELESVNHSFPVCRDHTQAAIDMEGCALCRIEELEEYIRLHVGVTECVDFHKISTPQIDAAWKRRTEFAGDELILLPADAFGIVRCDHENEDDGGCYDCHNRGWVKR